MRIHLTRLATVLVMALLAPGAPRAADTGSGSIVDKENGPLAAALKKKGIEGLLVDDAAGSVSAAALAGIEADAVNVVENVRDFSALVKAFDSNNEGFGISIAPARTRFPIPSINLGDYSGDGGYGWRLLGGITLSYAQGKTSVSGTDYTRRAVSFATNAYLRADDDPIVAVHKASGCVQEMWDKVPDDRPTTTEADAVKAVEERTKLEARVAAGDKAAGQELAARDKAGREARRVDDATVKAALATYNACIETVLKKHTEKWNRTRYSVSFGTGSVKRSDGSESSTNLGRTLAATVLYGFDGIKALEQSAALAVTVRRSQNEPVLETLGTGAVKTKNSTLAAVRLSGGSSVFRGLLEANNAKESDITTTQRTLNRAVGIDYRIMDGLWLNLRYGKQRKVDGTGNETGSFLLLNYSPSALLGH